MKRFGLLCIFLILVNFSMQIPKYENCPTHIIEGNHMCECCEVTCFSAGTQISAKACAEFRCPIGKQIGYHDENNTEEYPACCGYPICED